jgi:hypothetical protein
MWFSVIVALILRQSTCHGHRGTPKPALSTAAAAPAGCRRASAARSRCRIPAPAPVSPAALMMADELGTPSQRPAPASAATSAAAEAAAAAAEAAPAAVTEAVAAADAAAKRTNLAAPLTESCERAATTREPLSREQTRTLRRLASSAWELAFRPALVLPMSVAAAAAARFPAWKVSPAAQATLSNRLSCCASCAAAADTAGAVAADTPAAGGRQESGWDQAVTIPVRMAALVEPACMKHGARGQQQRWVLCQHAIHA